MKILLVILFTVISINSYSFFPGDTVWEECSSFDPESISAHRCNRIHTSFYNRATIVVMDEDGVFDKFYSPLELYTTDYETLSERFMDVHYLIIPEWYIYRHFNVVPQRTTPARGIVDAEWARKEARFNSETLGITIPVLYEDGVIILKNIIIKWIGHNKFKLVNYEEVKQEGHE